jgi:hypothetical protein
VGAQRTEEASALSESPRGKSGSYNRRHAGHRVGHSQLFVKEGTYVFITGRQKELGEAVTAIGSNAIGIQVDSLVGSNQKGNSMATKPRRNGSKELQAIEASVGEERAEGVVGNSALEAEIRRRAYQLYVERGGEHGRDLDDWLQAKREVESGALWPEQAIRKESATFADKEEDHVFRLDR